MRTYVRNGGVTATRPLLIRVRIDSTKLVLRLSALSSDVFSDYYSVAH